MKGKKGKQESLPNKMIMEGKYGMVASDPPKKPEVKQLNPSNDKKKP